MKGKALVVYDGKCRFCVSSIEQLKRLDWFGVVDYGNAWDDSILRANPEIDLAKVLARLHLITPGRGAILDGFHAFRWLAGRLPVLWIVWPILWLPGAATLGTKVYDMVARNRFVFGACEEEVCNLPSAAAPPRRGAPREHG